MESAGFISFEEIRDFAKCVKLRSFPLRILPEGLKIVMFISCVGYTKVFFFLSAPEGIVYISLSGPPLVRPDWLLRLSVRAGRGLSPLCLPCSGRGRTAALGGEGRSGKKTVDRFRRWRWLVPEPLLNSLSEPLRDKHGVRKETRNTPWRNKCETVGSYS